MMEEEFEQFFAQNEPRLRRAFVARYGRDRGSEALSEAFAWAWQHWGELRIHPNPLGYLFRVGQSRTRARRRRVLYERPTDSSAFVEPQLGAALASLTSRQRVAVILIHGFGWQLNEVASLTGLSVSTVQNHLERGMRKLRTRLKAFDHDTKPHAPRTVGDSD